MSQNIVTPFKSGLITDIDPWSLPADAFSELNNFNVTHGRLEKRPGITLLGQLVGVDNNPTTDRVMGIFTSTDTNGVNQTVAFTQYVMNYWSAGSPGSWLRIDGGTQVFNGSDTDYYWVANWQPTGTNNRIFITNGKQYDGSAYDGIRYWDYTNDPTATVAFRPSVSTGIQLWGARLIFVLRGRLIALGTYEYDSATMTVTYHPQRARNSQYQNSNNWNDVIAGQGTYVDAGTGDHIVTARALRDSLIVYFTDSVWQLYYTGDASLPFSWKKLNDFRACGGKMASQGFDGYVAALGVRGITASTGAETQRIDDRIQDFVVNSVHTPNFNKVYCGRNYASRRWWILYPRAETSSDECDGVLVYHQDDKCWSTYSTTLNVLGYGVSSFDYTCDSFNVANNREWTCQEVGDATCQDYYWQDDQNMFLGGDRSGNVYILDQTGNDNGTEIQSSFVSGVINPGREEGIAEQLEYIDILTNTEKNTQCTVSFYQDANSNPYISKDFDLLPPLGYSTSIQDITQTNPAFVVSYQHGLSTGDIKYIYGVKGMKSINGGPYTVTVNDKNSFTLDNTDASGFSEYTGGGGIYAYPFYRNKIWKRIYAGGYSAQHRFSLQSAGPDDSLTIYAYRPRFRNAGRSEIH